jgi:hypothetical protein
MTPTEPNVTLSVKERNAETGQWTNIEAAVMAGKTLEAVLLSFADREVVVEVKIGEQRFFFAGTAHWMERMQRKGRAVLFAEAVELLRQKRPSLLTEIIPHLDEVASVFPGARVESFTLEGGQ